MRVSIQCLVLLAVAWATSSAEARAVNEAWMHPDTGAIYALPHYNDSAGRPASIHISVDEGQSWSRLPGVPDTAGNEIPIVTFAVVPGVDSNMLFAGTADYGLYRSIDEGATWTPWNDARIGIREISVAPQRGEAAWVVANDGAVYVSLDEGVTWTLVSGIADRTVTAIANSGGDMAWVGTDAGELIELASAGSQLRILSDNAPFISTITDLARTEDGTLYVGVEIDAFQGSNLYRTDTADLTSFVSVQHENNELQLRGLAAFGNRVHLIDFDADVINVSPGEPIDYMFTDDGGVTFSVEAAPRVFTRQLSAGACNGCEPWVLLAHAEGLYRKAPVGLGWIALAPVDEPAEEPPAAEPPAEEPPARADADLGVSMISPSTSTEFLAESTRRYELQVRNSGPDDVTDVVVEVEFTTWADTGSFISPVNSWGDSATIAGQNCERGRNSFSDEILLCRLASLAAGDAARILITASLPDKTSRLRIEAEVTASNNNDPNGLNDWNAWEWAVAENPETASFGDESGGGGSTGLLFLLGLLTAAFRRGDVREISKLSLK